MPTSIETTTAIQDKVFANLQVGQKAIVDSVRSWAETVETVSAKLPELVSSPPASPTQVLESTFGFTEKVLASQREFFTQVFDAAQPVTRAPQSAKANSKS